MKLRHLKELPMQINYTVKTLDQVDTILSTMLFDAQKNGGEGSFQMSTEDVIVLLTTSQELLQSSLDSISTWAISNVE